MAGAEGFEPPDARTKTWCLTAWRRPNKFLCNFQIFFRYRRCYSSLSDSCENPNWTALLYSKITESSIIFRISEFKG